MDSTCHYFRRVDGGDDTRNTTRDIHVVMKDYIVLDLETDGLEGDTIWCVGWCTGRDASGVVTDLSTLQNVLDTYTPIFHNAAFDVKVLRKHGYKVHDYHDTMVMSYVLEPGLEGGHSLRAWGDRLEYPKGEHDDWSQLSDEMMAYCKRDAELTWGLWQHLHGPLLKDERAYSLYRDVELPFVEVIMTMEATGFYIDVDKARTLCMQWTAERQSIKQQHMQGLTVPGKEHIYKRGYYKRNDEFTYNHCKLQPFNPNSSQHKAHLLFVKPDRKPLGRTESGEIKVDSDVLKQLSSVDPMAEHLLVVSNLTKHIGMVNGYLERLDGRRLRGSFNQCLTLTGRLSSSNPNLQNIPTRGEMGHEIRGLFVAPNDDWRMVGIDLSNIEGRVLAHYLSLVEDDNRMADTFTAGVDFHQANADAWGVSRPQAKTLLYATLYGAGDSKLGDGDKKAGAALRAKLDANMPALQRLKDKVWASCRKRGFVYTQFGRRLVYPTIRSNNKGERGRAERQVFNALLQGTAADVLKILVNMVMRDLESYGAYLIANVHDEALFYIKAEDADEFAAYLSQTFREPLLSHCPIEGDAKVGMSWKEIH